MMSTAMQQMPLPLSGPSRVMLREGLNGTVRIKSRKQAYANCCFGGKKFFDALKCIVVRQMFLLHALLTVWRVTVVKSDFYWVLGLSFILMFVESFIVLGIRRAKEWKWMSPCVLLYLLCIVPAIFILELDKLDRWRLEVNNTLAASPLDRDDAANYTAISMNNDDWVLMLEQALLVIVIFGRWLLPKGDLTRDQLSTLLLVYLGTASDITDFFSALNERTILPYPGLVTIVLITWSWSIMQFGFVVTAKHDGHDDDEYDAIPGDHRKGLNLKRRFAHLIETEAWGICVSLMMLDGPYAVIRFIMIFSYNISSYSNYFFLAKNCTVIALQGYRIRALHVEYLEAKERRKQFVKVPIRYVEEDGEKKLQPLAISYF